MNHAADEKELKKIVKAMTEFGEIVKQVIIDYISFLIWHIKKIVNLKNYNYLIPLSYLSTVSDVPLNL